MSYTKILKLFKMDKSKQEKYSIVFLNEMNEELSREKASGTPSRLYLLIRANQLQATWVEVVKETKTEWIFKTYEKGGVKK